MSGSVGYRSRARSPRSATAVAKRPSVMVSASHRVRSTATVCTSTRSGELTPASRSSSHRARCPSSPSSARTLARTDASITITGGPARRRCRRRPAETRPGHLCDERSARGPPRESAARPGVAVPRRGIAEETGPAPPPGAGARRGLRREGLGPTHSACLHYAIMTERRRLRRSAERPTPPNLRHHVSVARREVLILLDDDLVARLDALGGQTGLNRSELLRRGALAVLEAADTAAADRDLQAAYRRRPQDPAIVEAVRRLAATTAPDW